MCFGLFLRFLLHMYAQFAPILENSQCQETTQNFNLYYNFVDSVTLRPNIWFEPAKNQRYIKYKPGTFHFWQIWQNLPNLSIENHPEPPTLNDSAYMASVPLYLNSLFRHMRALRFSYSFQCVHCKKCVFDYKRNVGGLSCMHTWPIVTFV